MSQRNELRGFREEKLKRVKIDLHRGGKRVADRIKREILLIQSVVSLVIKWGNSLLELDYRERFSAARIHDAKEIFRRCREDQTLSGKSQAVCVYSNTQICNKNHDILKWKFP